MSKKIVRMTAQYDDGTTVGFNLDIINRIQDYNYQKGKGNTYMESRKKAIVKVTSDMMKLCKDIGADRLLEEEVELKLRGGH